MKHILIIFIFIIPLCLFANHKTDSLINISHEYEKQSNFESDTSYINILIDIAKKLELSNPDSSVLFSNKAYELSIKYKYPKKVLESAFVMTSVYIKVGESQKILQIANEILPIAEKTNQRSLGEIYNMIGVAYRGMADYDKTYLYQAKEMYQKAIETSEKHNDAQLVIRSLNNLANTYLVTNDQTSALECLYRAVGYAERAEEKDFNAMSAVYYQISNIYYFQKKFDRALVEIHKGIEVAEKNNDIMRVRICLYLAGMVYMELNKYDEALEYFNRYMEVSQVNFDVTNLQLKEFVAHIYYKMGLYEEALNIAYEALKIWEDTEALEIIATFKSIIAQIYYDQKQYHSSLKTYNEILETGINHPGILNTVHQGMSSIYEAQNNGMKALEHYKQYKIYSDSLFHTNLDEQIINLEAQNKYEKKEMELRNEQALKDAGYIKDKVRLQLIIVFVLILFVSVLTFLIFISRSRKKLKLAYSKLEDANKEIQLQKEEISMQSEELRTINEHLVQLIKFKQDISGMIVHDLKNPLSIMLGLTTSVPDNERLAILHDSAQRMLNLVLNILDINKYEDSKLELKFSRNDINGLIKSVTRDIGTALNFKQLNVSLNLQDDLVFSFDKDIIRRVLDNILNNAIKFSPTNETIHISSERSGSNIRVTIRNMGEPIPIEMQEAIFEPYGRVDRKENESSVKSTGLGLTFCKMAVAAHNGTIGVDSAEEKPTEFWFMLPN